MNACVPREVVGDDGASDGHLLEGEDELADPDEAHSVVPHQVLEGLLHLELHQLRAVTLHRGPCGGGGGPGYHEWSRVPLVLGKDYNLF